MSTVIVFSLSGRLLDSYCLVIVNVPISRVKDGRTYVFYLGLLQQLLNVKYLIDRYPLTYQQRDIVEIRAGCDHMLMLIRLFIHVVWVLLSQNHVFERNSRISCDIVYDFGIK